ncbi:hypothetical protein [Kribbella sp. NPDC004875]|uniref:hypothetical protein n=1 Tax=Kribbella sp. NPDC004875 TaxID=3364107 RepID=UPI003696DA66
MKPRTAVFSLAAAITLIAAAFVPTAQGATTATCSLQPGSVLGSGAHNNLGITVGWPPRNVGQPGVIFGIFPAGAVRLSTTFTSDAYSYGATNEGWVVEGDTLYYRTYSVDIMNNIDPGLPNDTQPVGGGWSKYTAVEVSRGARQETTAYGLRSDGTLFRWSADRWLWKKTGSATGFASVKSMALISKTPTYDTFLANTRGGALYTIRIPTTSPMKPVVKPVRTRTWQGFEKLVASKCGNYGTLLVGIDTDTKTAQWYAVGRANGTATVIDHLSSSGPNFNDPVYFRWGTTGVADPLNGE